MTTMMRIFRLTLKVPEECLFVTREPCRGDLGNIVTCSVDTSPLDTENR